MKFDTYFNKTPLHLAIQNEDIEIIQLLLARPNIKLHANYISNANLNTIFNN